MMEPRKHLYNEGWESSTEEGNELFAEVTRLLQPVMVRYCEQGYSLREVSHTMVGAVTLLEAETVLLRNLEEHKAERETRKKERGW
jgi:hypothetical protein